MIITHEGLGGWTIEVVNGKKSRKFECSQYTRKHGAYIYFDIDAAMRDAEALDAAQKTKSRKRHAAARTTIPHSPPRGAHQRDDQKGDEVT